MKTIKGPAIFLAQFAGDESPFNSLEAIAEWAADLGFVGVQMPTWDSRLFDLDLAVESVRGNPAARQEWAVDQLRKAAQASANLGLDNHATFSGALAWPYFYPWPQRPEGLVEAAFDDFAESGVDPAANRRILGMEK